MNKLILPLVVSIALGGLTACQSDGTLAKSEHLISAANADQNQQFKLFSQQFIDDFWKQAPTYALYSGYHQYDANLQVPDAASRREMLAFIAKYQTLLSHFSTASLTPANLIDYRLIENQLASTAWEINTFRAWQWDPSSYNVAGGFAQIINENYAPLDVRLRSALARLENVPAYYKAAEANINDPTLEHTQLAIVQNQGAFSVLSDELLQTAADSGLTAEEKQLFKTRFAAANVAINGYISFLKTLEIKLQQQGARSFRIGEKLYEQKFFYDIQSGMTAKALYEKALIDKEKVQGEMAKITDKLWSKYFTTEKPKDEKQAIRQLIDKLSVNHVKRENFVAEVKQQLPQLIQFVNDHHLVQLDKDKPLVVRETPAYFGGVAGASVSAPGPYEQGGNTYYNVTPLDGMSDSAAESYLREYNHWVLQILNIHEAIPGHYAQLVYANKSPSLIKSLFGNGAMIEGWAVYAERMMLEEGYGNFEPELWLMYFKWNLRVICNTILDYSIQVKGMTKAEAMDLMTKEAFQQQAEAEGKWRRATLSQVQLTSYYAGFRAIYDLRDEIKAKEGKAFNLEKFNEQFLSYGSAPVKYIRQLMLQQ
ncbi:DUF885 domain-containing protein [Shewanella yunxiaonensis]|uniref:DUF885 domain-containing protein n=1 Tax=Shewanella yunxiaonensis TaxID=2829809 RepID=A0ABX7YPG8_9GAMM|nr:DUF885 domain-containing protein [Shewanella yunxiaonensis]QUN04433.1 DUF885 domain-containing protein [Shewanella yunxiaonensis]